MCHTHHVTSHHVTGHVTHLRNGPHHGPANLPVEFLIRCCRVLHAPGPQDQLPVRMEVYRPNDGSIVLEVVYDMACLQFRYGVGATIVLCITVLFLGGKDEGK